MSDLITILFPTQPSSESKLQVPGEDSSGK